MMFEFLAAEGHHPNGVWLPGDILEVVWGTIAFAIFAGLFIWKALPAIKVAMAKRTSDIEEELSSARQKRLDAESERDSLKSALADSESEAERIIVEARATADTIVADSLTRAEEDAQNIRDRIPADVENLNKNLLSELQGEISQLSLAATEEVVAGNLDDATHQSLIESYINQVGVTS